MLPYTSRMDNAAIIQRFIDEVINQGRYEVCDQIVAEDFLELDPLPGQRQGREGLKEVIAMFRSAFPDIHWVTDESISSGEKVVTRFTWTGTQRGDFLGIPATGRPVTVKGVVIDRVVNSLMTDSRILMDTFGMMMQLGVIPPPA
ncbi:MAG TPA: ester cyclase [Candidatus Aquilonibacter sp.]|nr:ester cyclase [Candidatus Aquilonibacter sp.]